MSLRSNLIKQLEECEYGSLPTAALAAVSGAKTEATLKCLKMLEQDGIVQRTMLAHGLGYVWQLANGFDHVPGPWFYVTGNTLHRFAKPSVRTRSNLARHPSQSIASINRFIGVSGKDYSMGNLCLILAAPDLYQALVRAIKLNPELAREPSIHSALRKARGFIEP